MTTASRRRRRRRCCRRPCSTVAGPLDDEDLLCEILLRLPPQPSSLPRASAVCKRWRNLVSDSGFLRRFRLHHRHNLPLLGFFKVPTGLSFVPTLEAPNRVHTGCFSPPSGVGPCFYCLGCRHGLVLIFFAKSLQLLVWDPVTGDQHRIASPPGFDPEKTTLIHGAVLRAAGDGRYFHVVLVAGVQLQHTRALACVYSSETGAWGDIISTALPVEDPGNSLGIFFLQKPAVLVGNSLFFWLVAGTLVGILEFDMERQSLGLIQLPMDMVGNKHCNFWVMPADGGGLGVLFVPEPGYIVQLWKRKADCDGVASWGLGRTIEMDKLLTLHEEEKGSPTIVGFAEDNNVAFMWTGSRIFMLQLESLQSKELVKTSTFSYCYPLESVYATGTCAGGGHGRAELLLNK